jgi:hypothetical protein
VMDEEDMGHMRKKQKVKGKGKQAARWDAMFDRLVQFQQEHGHCLVPNRYHEDPSLGAWVSTQRRHFKILMSGRTDQTTPMTEERASRLASIGFAWATSDPRHVPWETRFKQLLEYKERFGSVLFMMSHCICFVCDCYFSQVLFRFCSPNRRLRRADRVEGMLNQKYDFV